MSEPLDYEEIRDPDGRRATKGPTMSSDIVALIARLEKATGPDRELDCAVFVATAPSPFVNYYPDCVMASLGGFAARVEIAEISHFTASIDAALTLVPDDVDWGVWWDSEGVHEGFCVYVWTDHPTAEDTFVRSPACKTRAEAQRHLPRLICIAALAKLVALRARSATP